MIFFVYLILLGVYLLFLGIGLAGWASARRKNHLDSAASPWNRRSEKPVASERKPAPLKRTRQALADGRLPLRLGGGVDHVGGLGAEVRGGEVLHAEAVERPGVAGAGYGRDVLVAVRGAVAADLVGGVDDQLPGQDAGMLGD